VNLKVMNDSLQSNSLYYPTDVSVLKEELKKYTLPLHGEMHDVGTLEISQESTLEDLKSQLLTLPAVITLLHEYRVMYYTWFGCNGIVIVLLVLLHCTD